MRSPRSPRDLRYPILGGAPGGDPPPPPLNVCLDCMRLRMSPWLLVLSVSSVALLKQTCSVLLLAYSCFGTSLASRSMIAQVREFVYKTNGKPYILGNKGRHTLRQFCDSFS